MEPGNLNYWDDSDEEEVFLPTIWIFIWFEGDEIDQLLGNKKNSTLKGFSSDTAKIGGQGGTCPSGPGDQSAQ